MIVSYDLPEILRKVKAEEEIIKRALKGSAKIQVYNFLYSSLDKDFYRKKIKRKLLPLNIRASVFWIDIENNLDLKLNEYHTLDFIPPEILKERAEEFRKSAKKCAEKVHRYLEKILEGEYLDNHLDPSVAKVVIHDFSMSFPRGISTGRKHYNDYILIFPPEAHDINEVVLHEFGHKLGLEHVLQELDIMYPDGLKTSGYFWLIKERNFITSALQWYKKKKIFERYFD